MKNFASENARSVERVEELEGRVRYLYKKALLTGAIDEWHSAANALAGARAELHQHSRAYSERYLPEGTRITQQR
jgi:hypothetical protein